MSNYEIEEYHPPKDWTDETYDEFFDRFEKRIDVAQAKDSQNIIEYAKYWLGYEPSGKQRRILRQYAESKDLPLIKPKGISEKKGKKREEMKLHYTTVTNKRTGKTRVVARIPKGQKGAGRYAKRI